jgi:hypothetical protein
MLNTLLRILFKILLFIVAVAIAIIVEICRGLLGGGGSQSRPRDSTQWIRGPGGEMLGRIEEAGDGQLLGVDKLGNIVGHYRPYGGDGGITLDQYGMIVSRGNTLVALILKGC